MKLTWAEFKAICSSKVMLMQMIEQAESYRLFAFDGAVKYETSFLKDSGADQVDFEANYKSKCNQKIGLGDSQPFSLPTFRTKLNATPAVVTISPNTNDDIQFLLTEERYATGGTLIVKNAELGDYFTAEVEDVDGIIPAPYRAALCEAWPVVSAYIEKQFVEVQGTYTNMKIDTYPLNAKLTAGLYLCIHYYAINSGSDREVAVNYRLTKKL